MPLVTETPVRAFAHCVVPRCPGAYEAEVDALRVETAFAFTENGGDIPGIERSNVVAQFADEADATCEHCGGHRDVSLTPRPQYQRLSGHDPMGLLGMPQYDPNKVIAPNEAQDAAIEALKAQVAALTEAMEKNAAKGDA